MHLLLPFTLLIALPSALWVYFDARRRDWHLYGRPETAWEYGLGVLLLWAIMLPVYLFDRRRVPAS